MISGAVGAAARDIVRRLDADLPMRSGLDVMRTMGHVWPMRIVAMGIIAWRVSVKGRRSSFECHLGNV